RVRIEGRRCDGAASGPESRADAFMRVRLTREVIRARTFRRALPVKARHRKIKTAPEKMHRAAFPDESCTKFLKHNLDLCKDSQETIGLFLHISFMNVIFGERNRIGYFIGLRMNRYFDSYRFQGANQFSEKDRTGTRSQFDRLDAGMTRSDD